MDSNLDMIIEVACMSVIDKDTKTEVNLPPSNNQAAATPASPAPAATNPWAAQLAQQAQAEAAQQAAPASWSQQQQQAPARTPWGQQPAQPGWGQQAPAGTPWGQQAAPPDAWANQNAASQVGWGGQPSPFTPGTAFPNYNQPQTNTGQQPAYNPYDPANTGSQPAYNPYENSNTGSQPAYNPYENSNTGGQPAYNSYENTNTGGHLPYNPYEAQPAWQPGQQGFGSNAQQSAAQNSPWIGGGPAAPTNSKADLERFANSLQGRSDKTIAEWAMDPSLPPVCVDAALKLQEMVLTGHFGERIALQALRLVALNNGVLDDGVIQRAKTSAGADPDELARHAAGILQQAGLVTESDVAQAENNMSKHNNSFADSLLSSGKVDKLILEAAQDCHPLIASGRLRQDQAIIALHYCARSRTSLQDALQDLSIEVI
jgi:hypothetical protein